jgi:hypothetical protein
MKRFAIVCLTLLVSLARGSLTYAQQRPLVTQDPETIGGGRVLIDGGFEFAHDQHYPASGLTGDLLRLPTIGFSVGLGSIVELRIDGGLFDALSINERHPAALSSQVTATGDSTHDIEDTFISTKIRVLSEEAGRPALGLRFATKLPTASVESGLGLGTTDFYVSLLAGKTAESVRFVGNVGVAILGDPTSGTRQNDVITYGLSIARAMTESAEIVGEVNGRASVRSGEPFPGTESRSIFRFGGRYTRGSLRLDGAVFVGLTNLDPTIGFTAGFTYVFDAFTAP